jgi:hypothetical protein
MLVNEGALVLKFWFHLTKDGQKRSLKALEKGPEDRVARHQVELGPPQDLRQAAGRRRPRAAHDQHPVGAVDHHRRRGRPLSLADGGQDPARRRCGRNWPAATSRTTPVAPPMRVNIDGRNVLSELNLKHKADGKGIRGATGALAGQAVRAGARSALQGTFRWSAPSKGRTLPARAAPSAASPPRSMRGTTRSFRSRRRPRKSAPSPTCGVSGGTCRAVAASRSSTAPGTAACWSNASRASAPRTDWLRAYSEINDFEHELSESAPSSASSGCRSARKSS